MTRPNRKTVRSELIRLGFEDTDAALAGLARLGHAAAPLEAILGRTADPDAALDGLLTLADAAPDREDLLAALADDEGTAMRLLSVLGASTALAHHLHRHPEHWRELTDPVLGSTRPAAYAVRADLIRSVGAGPGDLAPD